MNEKKIATKIKTYIALIVRGSISVLSECRATKHRLGAKFTKIKNKNKNKNGTTGLEMRLNITQERKIWLLRNVNWTVKRKFGLVRLENVSERDVPTKLV